MSTPLYGLTARTAGELKRLIANGGGIGGRATTGSAARGSTWCKVTGAPDGDGWHPGLVSLDVAGEWEDLTAEVLVAAADGSDLVEDERYLCTRTGDAADGTARFRCAAPGGGDPYHVDESFANSPSNTIGSDNTWLTTGVTLLVTMPGTYIVSADVGGTGTIITLGNSGYGRIEARLWDVTNGVEVTRNEVVVYPELTGTPVPGSKHLEALYAVTGTTQFAVQARRRTGDGTVWTSAVLYDPGTPNTISAVRINGGAPGPTGATGATGATGTPGTNAPDDANAVIGARVFGF